ncbi:MAG: GPR endopeptidase [Firmicutes bacterium]|nr:GPR endopeptidase [Bacillota bacterium]
MKKFMAGKQTDLALEFDSPITTEAENKFLKRTVVNVDEAYAKKIGKAAGQYITVETKAVREGSKSGYGRVSAEIAQAIVKLADCKSCMVVGLGNPNLTADALGKYVTDRILITRHIQQKGIPAVSAVCPNVLGVTGIESFDVVKGVVQRVKPECIIAVDSLAGAAAERIASAFQISNAGITPGSGVSNHRARLDKQSLGCTVISLGVPLVVYASTLIEDAFAGKAGRYDPNIGAMLVTPKDVDLYVTDCADIIARAINLAFFGNATPI